MKNELPLATQKRLILSVLATYADNLKKPKEEHIPWHITPLGWAEYCHHFDKEVRDAARTHPCCPAQFVAQPLTLTA